MASGASPPLPTSINEYRADAEALPAAATISFT